MHFPAMSLRCLLPALIAGAAPVRAVIFDATGDPLFNITAPGGALADSGWQYQGLWGSFLGTPIGPNHFITAAHVGGGIGDTFYFQGHEYTTDDYEIDPLSDLRIWRVTEAFPYYAPLYTASNELGRDLVVIGRGTQRGGDVLTDPGNVLAGWYWGAADGTQRWGTNTVSGFANGNSLLAAQFNHIGGTEAHLSTGDSGGAVFIQDPADNVWKLAGINFAVTGPYFTSLFGEGLFNAALFNQTGFFIESAATPGVFIPAAGSGEFYATRISARMDFIQGVVAPEPGSALLLLLGAAGLAGIRRRAAM
jgi:hypothetical protein